MTRVLVPALLCLGLLASLPAAAATLKYYPDPVYQKLNKDEPGPMDDMMDLAKSGDVRAAFILGDLYTKGKGGLPQDYPAAEHWFETAAMHGDTHSLVRLAALAKRRHEPIAAYKWYSLAIDALSYGNEESFAIKARKDVAANLTSDDIHKAKQMADAWDDLKDKTLRAEKEAAAKQPAQPPAGEEKNGQN